LAVLRALFVAPAPDPALTRDPVLNKAVNALNESEVDVGCNVRRVPNRNSRMEVGGRQNW
jgi:hypothetical protein